MIGATGTLTAHVRASPPLPSGRRYRLGLADPPWAFVRWSPLGNLRGAEEHYPRMLTEQIAALPVAPIFEDDAVLLMWAIWNRLPDALEVIRAWGFDYKTCAWVWFKRRWNGSIHAGMGYYTRANPEPCLLATRGNGLSRVSRGVLQVLESDEPTVIASIPREHSRKPDGQYDLIDRLFGDVRPRIELFARRGWHGWDRWGLEACETATLPLPDMPPAEHPVQLELAD